MVPSQSHRLEYSTYVHNNILQSTINSLNFILKIHQTSQNLRTDKKVEENKSRTQHLKRQERSVLM